MILFLLSLCSIQVLCLAYISRLAVRSWYADIDQPILDTDLPGVSILIIARDEADHISSCLQSIVANDYPNDRYEVILVDDHSTDGTLSIAKGLGISKLITVSLADFDLSAFGHSYKKAARYIGSQHASFEWILQSDADVICGRHWIRSMTARSLAGDIICGPIHILPGERLLGLWQSWDNIASQVMTYLGIITKSWYSANGANLMYKKELYTHFNEDHGRHLASGDDIFLVSWAAKHAYDIDYCRHQEAIVKTYHLKKWRDLISQRLRWATKTKAYWSSGLGLLMVLLGIGQVLLWVLLPLLFWQAPGYISLWIGLMIARMIIDYYLLSSSARFFGMQYALLLSPILSLMQQWYHIIIGGLAIFKTRYNWKGRRVS